MNEAFELTLTKKSVSFAEQPVELVIGAELKRKLTVDEEGLSFTDVEWQVIYCRVLVEDRWYFLPHELYDEIDERFGDEIGERIWSLTARL